MRNRTLYLLAKEPGAGSFLVSLGLMEILKRTFKRVAFFKPVVENVEDDDEIKTVLTLFEMRQSYDEAVGLSCNEVEKSLATQEATKLYEKLILKMETLLKRYDFVLCMGVNDHKLKETINFDINVKIAKNFSSPVVGVFGAKGKKVEAVKEEILLWLRSLKEEGLVPFAFFINQATDNAVCDIGVHHPFPKTPCFTIGYDEKLDRPTILDFLSVTNAEVVHMKDPSALERIIHKPLIAAMHPEHFLEYFEEQDLIVVPADRSDILVTILAANQVVGYPTPSAVILGGRMPVAKPIMKMIEEDESFRALLLRVPLDTMQIVLKAQQTKARITPRHKRKVDRLLGLFGRSVDGKLIEERLETAKVDIVTPTMFLHRIFAKAAKRMMRVVLPESEDERILRAAERIQQRKIAQVILIGQKKRVENRAAMLSIDLEGVEVVDIATFPEKERYVEDYYQLRKDKGLSYETARETMENTTYFATMMVYEGYADAMVSGATHTTRETVRPALQIIKTKPGIDIVSSIFFMCLDTKVLVYGDCAIVPDPTPAELAQIAIESAETAKAFGIEPRVAMLSYSTGESGVGKDVQKVREATHVARSLRPDLLIEGPMQYDAAIDPEVAQKKMPNSQVAGKATVFIFPDLNTGNNTYKAVQRSTGAIAIGPILQGLNKPVNDLSRGCSVDDIVSTVAISAIQAQQVAQE